MAHVFLRRPRKLVALSAVMLFASLLLAPSASATGAATESTPLLAPTDLTATYRSGGVDLGWTRWNQSSSVTGWEYRTATAEADLSDTTWIAASGVAGSAQVTAGLTIDATHYFQVRAVNASTSSPASDTASVYLGDTPAGSETYKVEMTRINGDRSTVDGVKAADKAQVNEGGACDDITVTVPEGSDDAAILAAADAKSTCHSINTGSRYIDADGDVHNFQSGKRTYWMITVVEPDPPVDPVVVEDTDTYKVEMTRINGDRSTVDGVKAADKVQVRPGNVCDDIVVTVPEGSDDSAILAAADAKSTCHSISTGSRYIDADGDVHNFQSGKRTYWMITVVEPDPPVDPVVVEDTDTYKVEMTRINGDRSTVDGVKAADKVQVRPGNVCDDIVVTVPEGSDDSAILAAADAMSACHSISTGSRYIDADGEVHNFGGGASIYWMITAVADGEVIEPANTATFNVIWIYVYYQRSGGNLSEMLKGSWQIWPGHPCFDVTVSVSADGGNSAILEAAEQAISCGNFIADDERYIDADNNVHGYRSGATTYWRFIAV